MLDDSERIEAARRISAVRRWSRNGDVLALCDLLEKAVAAKVGLPDTVTLQAGQAPLCNVTPCLACEKRRKGNAKRVARHRDRKSAATKAA